MVQTLNFKVLSVEKLFSPDNIECSFSMFDFVFDILKILGEFSCLCFHDKQAVKLEYKAVKLECKLPRSASAIDFNVFQ